MRRRSERQRADDLAWDEPAHQHDALAPWADVANQGYQCSLASKRFRPAVAVVVIALGQNPITSRRRWSLCSRPRCGSRRAST